MSTCVQALFAAPEADAKKLLEEARTVCLKWFSSYMEVSLAAWDARGYLGRS